MRIVGSPPRLDGRLDDAAWRLAVFDSEFRQSTPHEGAPPIEKTEIAFLFDDDALYVGARMHSANPREVRRLLTRLDHTGSSEQIIVSLDTYRDRRTAYSFGLTAAGVRLDYFHATDDEHDRDYSFDPVWSGRVAFDSTGWTAEMRIPLSQLRFNSAERQLWGFNVKRRIPARNEDDFWVLVPRDETGWASRFGDLEVTERMRAPRRAELTPYVASTGRLRDLEPGNPFPARTLGARVGADAKVGIGPNLTLEATVNPDFGQVEADPAVVNLTAFETELSERRPFFVEGRQLLEGDGPEYFYSRRIGAEPHGSSPADFADRPDASTILGAAKLTGHLGRGLSIGALAAFTDRENARTFVEDSGGGGTLGRLAVEPRTAYGVLRARQELGASGSTAGLILTGMRRVFGTPEARLTSVLDREAYSGGIDWNLRTGRGTYRLSGYAGLSYVGGAPPAILRLQQSSARYFQRPDVAYVWLDSSRTSLIGYTGSARLSKEGGRHWLWNAGASFRTPAFELNDLGRQSTADVISATGRLAYRENRARRPFRDYEIGVDMFDEWDFGGIRQFTEPALTADVTWRNFWTTSAHVGYTARALSDVLTRGGPLMGTGQALDMGVELATNPADPSTWTATLSGSRDELGGRSHDVSGSWSRRGRERWEFAVSPRYSRSVDTRQYIVSRSGGSAATYGRRYVFASVEREEIAIQFRCNYGFSPDLSLEMYAEPFVSSGLFYNYGELSAARSRALRRYGTGGTTVVRDDDGTLRVTDGARAFSLQPDDFTVRSFRGSVVLRWAWRPGSTAFLVWQQRLSADLPEARRLGMARLLETLSGRGDHVLALKISYWMPAF